MVRQDWSLERRLELYAITRKLLNLFRESRILDAITVVHGYEQLATAYPEAEDFWRSLRLGILHLASLLETRQPNNEVNRLDVLAAD